MSVQCTIFMNDIHKTCASHSDLKPRFVLVVHLYITCKCSVFLYSVTKELSIFRSSKRHANSYLVAQKVFGWTETVIYVKNNWRHTEDFSIAKGLKLPDLILSLLWLLKTDIGYKTFFFFFFAHNVTLRLLCFKVLHHVDYTGNGKDYPLMEELFRRTKCVLRPKGLLVILTVSPSAKDVVWYTKLHHGLTDRYFKLFPTMEQFLSMFDDSGFDCHTKLNILGAEFFNDHYDAEGPLKEEWRKSVSLYGLASSEEIKEIESNVREMKENGMLEEFLRRNDKALDVGVFTLIVCASVWARSRYTFNTVKLKTFSTQ